jgi:hypothetical protein
MMPHGGLPHSRGELIHRSAWKGRSANFASTEISEVRQRFIANSSPFATMVPLVKEQGEEAWLRHRKGTAATAGMR